VTNDSITNDHSTLLQFIQLYQWVPGYKQWWISTTLK